MMNVARSSPVQRQIRMRLPHLTPVLALLLALGAGSTHAQNPAIGIGPLPDSTEARIRAEIEIPDGFDLTIFAAPPHLTYPTAIAPAGDGVIFVATDPNLLFGQERYLGRVLRFVDSDGDGVADSYSVFADSLDAVRGLAFDGERLYAMHAPTLVAYEDLDGDGVADERTVLIEGLGFGLDDRIGDHTVNGIRLGIDGWLYIAVGDYGFLDASGADGTRLRLHAGGVLRVRPDGSELELVARGTRNIYDLALDDRLRIFSRDNNNNGQGWNSMFHYLPHGADAGYPSLFRNFPEETHPPIADFGPGAATTTLWVEEPHFPSPLQRTLLSSDWALNEVYRHDLTARGGAFEVDQHGLISVPRPVDMEIDPDGALLIASLSGGSYDYAGEHVGYLLHLRPTGTGPDRAIDFLPEGEVVNALLSASSSRRLAAQRRLLAAGLRAEQIATLEHALGDGTLADGARVAALFTLKQALGAEAHPALMRHLDDDLLRPLVLQALVDRRHELAGVPAGVFARALSHDDPFTRTAAVRGISRLSPANAPALLMRAALDADPVVAHLARRGLADSGNAGAAAAFQLLDRSGSDSTSAAAALEVLGRIHSSEVVDGLIARLDAADPGDVPPLAGTLGRLHHREGPWDGEWWGNQPPTEGPYLEPVRWSESPRIHAAIGRRLSDAEPAALAALAARLEREATLPRGSAALLAAATSSAPAEARVLAGVLLGGRDLDSLRINALARYRTAHPPARDAVVAMLAADPASIAISAPHLAAAAADSTMPAGLRARVLLALARGGSGAPPELVLAAHASAIDGLADPALLQAWRRFTADAARAEEIGMLLEKAGEGTEAERMVAYGALLRISLLERHPEAVRRRAASAIEAGWGDPGGAGALRAAVRAAGLEERFGSELGEGSAG